MEERQIVLDFTGCKYITEVHWRIRDTFHFPGFYGENLDALWDMGCDYIGSWKPETTDCYYHSRGISAAKGHKRIFS